MGNGIHTRGHPQCTGVTIGFESGQRFIHIIVGYWNIQPSLIQPVLIDDTALHHA